jgi:hypothetical protein
MFRPNRSITEKNVTAHQITADKKNVHPKFNERLALLKPSEKVGVKGVLPLGCFPLWGREGVTLRALDERKRMTEKQGFNRAERFFIYTRQGPGNYPGKF